MGGKGRATTEKGLLLILRRLAWSLVEELFCVFPKGNNRSFLEKFKIIFSYSKLKLFIIMFSFFEPLRKFLKWEKVAIDNFIFRLHYKVLRKSVVRVVERDCVCSREIVCVRERGSGSA